MKRLFACSYGLVLIALFMFAVQGDLFARSSTPQSGAQPQSSEAHRSIPTVLTKSLDSRKLKPGDPVVCETTAILRTRSGQIPAGTKIVGHVTEAKAVSKGDSESSLGIAFDKIELKGGETIPIKGVIRAVAPSLPPNEVTTNGMVGGLGMGGGGGSGKGQDVGDLSAVPPPDNGSSGANSGIHPLYQQGPTSVLNVESLGVLGIDDLDLGKDSVLHSTGKEVKLNERTQIMVSVTVDRPKH